MQKRNLKVLLVAAMVISGLCVSQAQALDITFTSDGVIQEPDTYDNVHILNDATVDMTAGYITNEVRPQDQSTFNLSGGFINMGLYPSGSSTVNITGGTVRYLLDAGGQSIVNIAGGTISDYADARDQSTINFSGGLIGELCASGSGTINITGGAVSHSLYTYESNQVNINIYDVEMINSYHFYLSSGTVTIYGGSISLSFLILYPEANLNIFGGNVKFGGFHEGGALIIYGRDFNYSPDSYLFTGSLLLGGQIIIENLYPEEYEYFRSNLVVVPADVSRMVQAVFEKAGMAEELGQAMDKDRQAYNALGQLLESGEYGDLNKNDIVKARQKLHAAIGHQAQSLDTLHKSMEKLKDVLAALGWQQLLEQLLQ